MLIINVPDSAHTILVVEDDPDVRRALTELLSSEGYKVAATADGGEALQTLRGGLRPAVIPVVLVTAAGFSPDSMRSQLGPIEMCPKPIQPAELLETLARLAQVKGTPPAYS